MPVTAVSSTLLLQHSCTRGQGSVVPIAGWGTVALHMSHVQTYPCLGPRGTILEGAYEAYQEGPGGSLSPESCKPAAALNPKWPMATLLHLPSHTPNHKMCPSPQNKLPHHGSQVPQLPHASGKGWESSATHPLSS